MSDYRHGGSLSTAPDHLRTDIRHLLLLDAALASDAPEAALQFVSHLKPDSDVAHDDLEVWHEMFKASLRELRTIGAVLNVDQPVVLSQEEWAKLEMSVNRIKEGLRPWGVRRRQAVLQRQH